MVVVTRGSSAVSAELAAPASWAVPGPSGVGDVRGQSAGRRSATTPVGAAAVSRLARSSPVVAALSVAVSAAAGSVAGAPARHAESGMSEPVASAQAAAPV